MTATFKMRIPSQLNQHEYGSKHKCRHKRKCECKRKRKRERERKRKRERERERKSERKHKRNHGTKNDFPLYWSHTSSPRFLISATSSAEYQSRDLRL
eukprot:Awhi_evm1s2207